MKGLDGRCECLIFPNDSAQNRDEKHSIAKNIEDFCKAVIIGNIGNVLILFKQNPDIVKRKIII